MGVFVIELLILVAVLGALAYPLMAVKAETAPELAENELSDLMYRKEAAYTALKDLEFDMRTGKIGAEDYKGMKASLEAEAISLLSLIDSVGGGAAPAPVDRKAEKHKGKFCPECGARLEKVSKFCPDCGHKL